MICLTGDIHHPIGNPVQSFYKGSETSLAVPYLQIALKYDIKVTLFITGKTFVSDQRDIEEILRFSNLEIGGHTWSAFRPRWLFKVFGFTTGSIYGPKLYQSWDINKTLRTIETMTGRTVYSWRTHAYRSTKDTYDILDKTTVRVVSDELGKDEFKPTSIPNLNLVSLPINVMPDHEHVYYGTPERIERQKRKDYEDVFTNEAYSVREYGERIIKRIEEIEKSSGVATLLLHPQTMYLTDQFDTFERICAFIRERKVKTIWCKEAVEYV